MITRSYMQTDESKLTPRQRLALTAGVLNPQTALATPDGEIDFVFLCKKKFPIENLRASKLLPLQLKERGVERALHLRELGFDALDLTEAAFCASAIAAFGASEVKQAFLINASDAVAVAGTVAALQLGVETSKLLELTAGSPTQAKAVLQQLAPRGGALVDVPASVLLDAGLRAPALCELGYHCNSIRDQCGATEKELRSLGF